MLDSTKALWKNYSYSIVKMFINQFAIAIFGLTLAIATGKTDNATLQLITSIFSALFYLFLIYSMTWDIGAADKVRVDAGRAARTPLRGLAMSFWANIPNIILGLLIVIFTPLGSSFEWAGNTAAVSKFIALLLEGMYTGLLALDFMGSPLNSYAWPFLVIILPAMLTATLSYLAGLNNFRISSLFGLNYDAAKKKGSSSVSPQKPKK